MNSTTDPSIHKDLEIVLAHVIQDFLRYMKQYGLSTPQINALMYIYHAGECQVSSIGTLADVSSAAASQLVERLVQQGLVERREDPTNRRTKILKLSEKGSLLIQRGVTTNPLLADLMASLTADQRNTVQTAFSILAAAVQKYPLLENKRMATMHRMRNDPKTMSGPETTGSIIHWAYQYDIFTRLMGLGVNRSNSRMVIEMAKIKPGDKILDVGCGTGNLTLTAEKIVGESGFAYGLDASPEMIEIARKKATRSGSKTIFDIGLIEKIAFPNATFDVVICRLVIHHLPDNLKRLGFSEILRVLKPGGEFFLADFNPPSNPILAHVTSALVGHSMMQSNVWGIPSMLTEAGFVDISSGSTQSAFLAYVRGRKPV